MVVSIDPAESSDLSQITALLQEADLPTADVEPIISNFLVARSDGELIGCVGLEVFGKIGLLRSLVVESSSRNSGVAGKLCATLFERAREQGVLELYLLTTTARDYFTKDSFVEVRREEAPETIRQHSQFTNLCPSSAILMVLRL